MIGLAFNLNIKIVSILLVVGGCLLAYMLHGHKRHILDAVDAVRMVTIPERNTWAERQLELLKCDPEECIWPATTKQEVPRLEIKVIAPHLNIGEIACYVSHMRLYREMIRNPQWKRLLILEDDIQTTRYFHIHHVQRALDDLDTLDPEWDMLYLGVCWDMCSNREAFTQRVVRTYFPGCTHAYIISQRGAQRLIHLLYPIQNSLDRAIKGAARAEMLHCYAMEHNMFVQERKELKSELGHEREVLRMCLDRKESEPA